MFLTAKLVQNDTNMTPKWTQNDPQSTLGGRKKSEKSAPRTDRGNFSDPTAFLIEKSHPTGAQNDPQGSKTEQQSSDRVRNLINFLTDLISLPIGSTKM